MARSKKDAAEIIQPLIDKLQSLPRQRDGWVFKGHIRFDEAKPGSMAFSILYALEEDLIRFPQTFDELVVKGRDPSQIHLRCPRSNMVNISLHYKTTSRGTPKVEGYAYQSDGMTRTSNGKEIRSVDAGLRFAASWLGVVAPECAKKLAQSMEPRP